MSRYFAVRCASGIYIAYFSCAQFNLHRRYIRAGSHFTSDRYCITENDTFTKVSFSVLHLKKIEYFHTGSFSIFCIMRLNIEIT